MRIFKTKTFTRWARKEGVTDDLVCKAVSEIEAGLIDAELGSGLYKKRIALKVKENEVVHELCWHIKSVIKHFLFMGL